MFVLDVFITIEKCLEFSIKISSALSDFYVYTLELNAVFF